MFITKEVDLPIQQDRCRSSFKQWIQLLLRILLGGLFVFSGLAKVFDLSGFATTLRQYAFLPDWSVPVLALLIPALEYGLGSWLALGFYLRQVRMALIGLLVLFSGAIVYQMVLGNTGSCGCFGSALPEVGGWWALLRNGVLIIMIFILHKQYMK